MVNFESDPAFGLIGGKADGSEFWLTGGLSSMDNVKNLCVDPPSCGLFGDGQPPVLASPCCVSRDLGSRWAT